MSLEIGHDVVDVVEVMRVHVVERVLSVVDDVFHWHLDFR